MRAKLQDNSYSLPQTKQTPTTTGRIKYLTAPQPSAHFCGCACKRFLNTGKPQQVLKTKQIGIVAETRTISPSSFQALDGILDKGADLADTNRRESAKAFPPQSNPIVLINKLNQKGKKINQLCAHQGLNLGPFQCQ